MAYASLDYQVNVQYADTPYGYSLYNLDLVQAPCDWETQTIGSSNTAVCIIDSGIQTDHPDLKGNMWVNTAEIAGNGIDDDGNGALSACASMKRSEQIQAHAYVDTAEIAGNGIDDDGDSALSACRPASSVGINKQTSVQAHA